MPQWKTADELARTYVVGEQRLLEYSRRGNLPMRSDEHGTAHFDERFVAKFFRTQPGLAVSFTAPTGPCLGVLGLSRIGDEPLVGPASATFPLGVRDAHRRSRRREQLEPLSPRVAVGSR